MFAGSTTTTTTSTLPGWYKQCQFNHTTVFNDNSVVTVVLALQINGFSFLLLFLIFVLAFFSSACAGALAPRGGECHSLLDWLRPLWSVRYQEKVQSEEELQQQQEGEQHHAETVLPRTYWGGMASGGELGTGREDDAAGQPETHEGIDLDGQMFIRFCMLGFKFCALGSLVGAGLITIYSDDGRRAVTKDNFLRFTASNMVGRGGFCTWVLVLASYVLTGIFMLLARQEWKKFLLLRREHFLCCATGRVPYAAAAQAQFSVLVEQVPPGMQDQNTLLTTFRALFPSVLHCHLLQDTRKIHNKMALHNTTRGCCSWCCHRRVQSFYRKSISQVMDLEQEFRHGVRRAGESIEFRHKVTGEKGEASSTAIVTFGSLRDRLAAEQMMLFKTNVSSFSRAWRVLPAPEERDIVWKSMSSPLSHVVLRKRLCTLMCVVGILFWSVPLLALQAATTPNSMEMYAPQVVRWFTQNPSTKVRTAYRVLTSYLPVLAMFAIWLVPPVVLECLSFGFERRKTKSEIAASVLTRNFSFQLASLYLLAVGGVIWNSVRDILACPFCAGQLLGATVPKVAVYFMTFVIARVGVTLPMLPLRLHRIGQVFRRMMGAGPESQEEEMCWWGYECTNVAVVLVIANMYSVIAPLIMPICAVYFAVAAAAYRWLFWNVYVPQFDGAGNCWFGLFDAAMVGLLGGSLTVCGIVALDGVLSAQFFATWLLPVWIVAFQYRCNTVYGAIARTMPLEIAIEVDQAAGPSVTRTFDPALYTDPVLQWVPSDSDDSGEASGDSSYASGSEG